MPYTSALSELPFQLGSESLGWVPNDGFHFIAGSCNRLREEWTEDRFILPVSTKGRITALPGDLFLKFRAIQQNENSILKFANLYGGLGSMREHFHSPKTRSRFGESLSMWCQEIGTFQRAFEIWEALQARDRKTLDALIPKEERLFAGISTSFPPPAEKPLFEIANERLLSWTNNALGPGIQHRAGNPACSYPGCNFSFRAKATPSVIFTLRIVGKGKGVHIEPVLAPTNLLAAVWFQFAGLVSAPSDGNKKITRCEICGEWMDISETARPTAKRMHGHCAHARRVRKWRASRGGQASPAK